MSTPKEINPKIKERLSHVYWSIHLYNLSLSELRIISDLPYNKSELKIVNSHTFDFYRITLQYCCIMEYNKILEYGRRNSDQNISSLYRLNELIHSIHNKSFSDKYAENKEIIKELKSSDFYGKMRELRDKKFAHADNHSVNTPFQINGFQEDDFLNGFNQLHTIKDILDNLTSLYDTEYKLSIPHHDNRTENFIKFHVKYKDFYYRNYIQTLKNNP